MVMRDSPRVADNATFHNSTQIPIPNTLHFGKDRIQPYEKPTT